MPKEVLSCGAEFRVASWVPGRGNGSTETRVCEWPNGICQAAAGPNSGEGVNKKAISCPMPESVCLQNQLEAAIQTPPPPTQTNWLMEKLGKVLNWLGLAKRG